MNIVLTATLLFILICMVLFPYNDMLPEKSVNFINDYFNYDDIINIYKTSEFYEVIFNDDIVIHFDLEGYWQEVSGNSYPIPVNFIDKKVLNTVKKTNPNAAIINIKKRWNMYVISLDNYINVFIDFAGMLIGQKVPD
uniref:PepSY-like domain-containing protein n=1 Tax=Brachyspira catarrhinii TaxID=2528966 RepID=UPI003F4B1243